MFLSNTSARLLRIPAESIAPTLRRIPKKNRTPEKEENIQQNVVLVKCIVHCKCYRISCVGKLWVIRLRFVIKFMQHSQNYVFERDWNGNRVIFLQLSHAVSVTSTDTSPLTWSVYFPQSSRSHQLFPLLACVCDIEQYYATEMSQTRRTNSQNSTLGIESNKSSSIGEVIQIETKNRWEKIIHTMYYNKLQVQHESIQHTTKTNTAQFNTPSPAWIASVKVHSTPSAANIPR